MQRYRHLRSPIRTELVMLLLIEQVQEKAQGAVVTALRAFLFTFTSPVPL